MSWKGCSLRDLAKLTMPGVSCLQPPHPPQMTRRVTLPLRSSEAFSSGPAQFVPQSILSMEPSTLRLSCWPAKTGRLSRTLARKSFIMIHGETNQWALYSLSCKKIRKEKSLPLRLSMDSCTLGIEIRRSLERPAPVVPQEPKCFLAAWPR